MRSTQVGRGWRVLAGRAAGRARPAAKAVRVLVVLTISLVILRATGLVESWAFYHPSRRPFADVPGVINLTFTTTDDRTLHGWFFPASEAGQAGPLGRRGPAILYLHGNAGTPADHDEPARRLSQAGFHVLLVSYRGYGRSSAERLITRDELLIDARAGLAAIRAQPQVDAARIGVMGISLGGVPASALAADEPGLRAVALIAPFSSFPAIAHTHVPVLGPLLIRGGLAPRDSVRGLAGRPLLLVHGEADWIVPPAHSARIEADAAAAGVDVRRVVIPGGDHNNLFVGESPAAEALAGFFARTLAHADDPAPK